MMEIVATTSLPAVDRPNADRWNAARSRQKREKTSENSGHYVSASSPPPEHRPLERRTLVPIFEKKVSQPVTLQTRLQTSLQTNIQK